MSFVHELGIRPEASAVELGRGCDGIVWELAGHPELVLKAMHHPFKLGLNRINLEQRILGEVAARTLGRAATRVFNRGTDEAGRSWLVRERVFDVFPRGDQASREQLYELIYALYPSADVSRLMLPDPTFDNIRWGSTAACPTPRWILIDP